ncbi:ribonuclease E inhibitor RraB [Catenovulum sp. 2E275]|uniref:ribonuclease E inhibitor RraB n=1 Tax=Catenovulum sp. 2E275 TaxID=2980497 RepID=UPI0021D00886|nr:ribonuclease E inhibitor RraB [Catenovulum sp. 2E275]MCU4674767.1 ribonuclease E inhibitor RraB [Catenovulum sp. 2E275]
MEYQDDPQAFTAFVIESLLEDGSDPDAVYEIEHHFSSTNFDMLEKAAVAVFKLNYEVTDAEEFETDDGADIFAFDAIIESGLDLEEINRQSAQMEKIAQQYKIQYDGWGTEYIPQDED